MHSCISRLTWKHSGGGNLDSREETAAGIGNRPPGTVFIPIPLLLLGLNGVICFKSGLTMVASLSSRARLDGCPAPPPRSRDTERSEMFD